MRLGTGVGAMNSDRNDSGIPTRGSFSDLGRYSGYGMAFALTIGLAFWAGIVLDQRLGTTPWLSLLGAFAGGASGFYTLYVRFILEPESKRDENE